LKNGSRSKWVYRFGGVGVLYLITQIVIGKDIVELIKQLFGVA